MYPDGGDPDDNACHVSSWDAWHVFSRGGVPTLKAMLGSQKILKKEIIVKKNSVSCLISL